MERTGEVIKVESGVLTVRFGRPEACERCGACGGEKHQTVIQISGDAKVGDLATVRVPEGHVAKASVLAYLLPLLGLLAGLFAGWALGGDIAAALGAALGLGTSFLMLKLVDGRLGGRFRPQLVAVVKKQDSE